MIKLNGNPINITIFSDKTSQVWKLPEEILNETNYAHITWEFEYEGEFMHLAQLKSLLDSHGLRTDLVISYLPYARQDKAISNSATFALYPFAKLLNTLKFNKVILKDPHSAIAESLIDNSSVEYPIKIINQIFIETKSDIMCFPDKGAKEKYGSLFPNIKALYGEKQRNPSTGWIESYELIGDPRDQSVLIVDDIIDGGMTFILLTKQLLKSGAREVNLYVSHGIFSKGFQPLKEVGINRIFTADGEVNNNIEENLKIRDVVKFIDKDGSMSIGIFQRIIKRPDYPDVALVTTCISENGGSPVTSWYLREPKNLTKI